MIRRFKGFLLSPLLPPFPPKLSPTQPRYIYLILAEVILYTIHFLSFLIDDNFRQFSLSWIPAAVMTLFHDQLNMENLKLLMIFCQLDSPMCNGKPSSVFVM